MAHTPPCFVIGRLDSERLHACLVRLDGLGIAAEVSPAVIPDAEPPWSPHYDDSERRRQLGYSLSRGEVGCFLAHRQVWQRILNGDSPVALVLEDDAELDVTRLGAVQDAATAIAGRACVVRLVSEPQPRIHVWRELGRGACLGLPTRPGNLTTAYLATREAAAALLAASESFDCPVDDFMNHVHLHRVDVFNAEPQPARHGIGRSEIGYRSKPSVGGWFRIKREFLRAWLKARIWAARLAARARLGLLFRKSEPPR